MFLGVLIWVGIPDAQWSHEGAAVPVRPEAGRTAEPVDVAPAVAAPGRDSRGVEDEGGGGSGLGRKFWDGVSTGNPFVDVGINGYLLWTMCRNSLILQTDRMLDGLGRMPPSESRDHILSEYDGLQDRWWFQACVTVSPLIAVDPSDATVTRPDSPAP